VRHKLLPNLVWDDLALVALCRLQSVAFADSTWAAHRFWRGPWLQHPDLPA